MNKFINEFIKNIFFFLLKYLLNNIFYVIYKLKI